MYNSMINFATFKFVITSDSYEKEKRKKQKLQIA